MNWKFIIGRAACVGLLALVIWGLWTLDAFVATCPWGVP